MRQLIVAEHMSLDGVIQSPGGPEEDPSDDFRLGGWTAPYADKAIGEAVQVLHAVPKHVATHRPQSLDWRNSHALNGDLLDAIRALKQKEGPNLLTWGSGDMVRQLLAAGLVDELRLVIYPVVLGRGKRLFDGSAEASAFTLANSTATAGGVLIARYVRSGEVRTGTFGRASR